MQCGGSSESLPSRGGGIDGGIENTADVSKELVHDLTVSDKLCSCVIAHEGLEISSEWTTTVAFRDL